MTSIVEHPIDPTQEFVRRVPMELLDATLGAWAVAREQGGTDDSIIMFGDITVTAITGETQRTISIEGFEQDGQLQPVSINTKKPSRLSRAISQRFGRQPQVNLHITR